MSLMSFIADAGEKLFGATPPAAPSANRAVPTVSDLNSTAGAAIANYVASQHLTAQNLYITYNGATKSVTITGIAADQATKEKIALCCGNVHSVSKVDEQMTVAKSVGPASTMYEVKAGDTLSKIAKSVYGDANAYQTIFEANKPMLSDPNKIYPSQQLRIPAKT